MSVQENDRPGDANTSQEPTLAGNEANTPMAGNEEVGLVNSGAVSSNAGATDPAKTPRGEEPPFFDQRKLLYKQTESNEATPIANQDYFATKGSSSLSRAETVSSDSNVSSPLQSAGASSSSLHSTGPVPTPAGSVPADSNELYSRLIKVQSRSGVTRQPTSGSTSNASAGPSRPSTKSNRLEGPNYPDQSFAALHRQAFTPPYPYLRSNSPYTSRSSRTSASPVNMSQEHLHLPGTSRTEGNTPAESPGLFDAASASRRGRIVPEELETSQYKAPSLHPTYHMGPKESHSLRKDFDAMTGHKTINNYEILKELGKGTHGKVKLARVLDSLNVNDRVAIKIVKRFKQKRLRLGGRETQEDRVRKEIAVLKKARHPHVVSLLEVIDDPDADKVYIILEFVEEGEMKWRRKADKWTVDFERHRIEREMEAWLNGEVVDTEELTAALQVFNSQREARAAEKRRILNHQKKLAYAMVSSPSRRSSTATILTDDEQVSRELAAKWSLEHGGDPENEAYDHGFPDRVPSDSSLAPTSGHESRADLQLMGGLESSTAFRDPFHPGSTPMSPLLGQGVSHASGSQLSDIPVGEDIESDRLFLAALKQVQREDDANTFDREDKPYRHVPCLSMTRCRECFRDTVLGLEYLHYQGIIHRDIKPANLLWNTEHRVKISDFGVSYLGHSPRNNDDDDEREPGVQGFDEVELARTVGTPAFYAPELCDPDLFTDGRDERRQIGVAMDVWALGVTLYCMIFARLPFDDPDNNEMALFHKIAKEEVFIPSMRPRAVRLRKTDGYEPKDRDEDALEYEEIGDELHDLLKRLLHKDPAQRILIAEIKCHPWVVKGMENLEEWLSKTDPTNYISDKKIHVTNEDVSAAMQPISVFERMKQGVKRLSSLVRGEKPRGRDARHRGDETAKDKSIGASSRASTGVSVDPSHRRSSLRGDELAHYLRASRPETEHPLSQSQVASPTQDLPESYFSQMAAPTTLAATPTAPQRPGPVAPRGSTSESVMTIRGARSRGETQWPAGFDNNFATPMPSGMGYNIYGKQFNTRPSHGLASKRSSASAYSTASGASSDNLSGSFDDAAAHSSPSIAMSSATAKGSLAAPSVLQEPRSATSHAQLIGSGRADVTSRPQAASLTYSSHQRQGSQHQAGARQRAVSAVQPQRPTTSSNTSTNRQISEDAMRRAGAANMRREQQDWLTRMEASESSSRPASRGIMSDCPPSPDDELWFQSQRQSLSQARPRSSTSTAAGYGDRHEFSAASSSDDVPNSAMFSDESRHPSMPSVISSVGSGSTSVQSRDFEETLKQYDASRAARLGSLANYTKVNDSLMSTGETVTPAMAGHRSILETADSGDHKQQQIARGSYNLTSDAVEMDDAGYVGDHDADEDADSDDEGIVFGGRHT